jgi:hypothetical protein
MTGNSHAIALTSATCSGGKTLRATRPRLVPQPLQALLGKPERAPARPQKIAGELNVRQARITLPIAWTR